MGNLISWDLPENAANYDKVFLVRATTIGGSYSAPSDFPTTGLDIAITEWFDLNGTSAHFYKLRFLDVATNTYSDYSAVITPSTSEPIISAFELRRFMQINTEYAPNDETLNQYIQEAEAYVNMRMPSLDGEANANKLLVKGLLIKFAAAALTLENMDEGHTSDPTKRLAKAEHFWKQFEDILSNLASTDDKTNFFVKVRDDYAYSSWGQEAWSGDST